MRTATPRSFKFGQFILDNARHLLLRDGVPVPVPRKVFEILSLLVDQAGETVRKEELIAAIWPGKAIEERNLTQHIYTLRRVLGDNPRTPVFVLTVPGKGYLFNHPLEEIDSQEVTRLIDSRPVGVARTETTEAESPIGMPLDMLAESPAQPIRPIRIKRYVLPLLLVLIVLLVGIYLARIHRRVAEGGPAATVSPLVTLPGLEIDPDFSPDGQHLAFAGGDSGIDLDIYVKKVNQGELLQLTSGRGSDHDPAWSPDGSRLAFLRGTEYSLNKFQLIVIPATGGAEQLIATVWGGLDWSPDGRYFAIIDEEAPDDPTSIYLLGVDGRERRRVTFSARGESRLDTTPRFSPDGRSIAFIRWKGDTVGDIFLVNLDNGQTRQLTTDGKVVYALQWAPSGEQLLFISNRSGSPRLWQIDPGGRGLRMIDTDLGDINKFDISPDGGRLAMTQFINDTTIELWPIPEGRQRDLAIDFSVSRCVVDSSRVETTPRFSPDGRRLAFISNRTGSPEIWLANPDCTNPTQLTSLGVRGLGSPRWSPDGRTIAFDLRRQGAAEVALIDVDGSNLRFLTQGYLPSWSRDGQAIYFNSEQTRQAYVWRIPVTGGAPVQVTQVVSIEPVEAVGGQTLYFLSRERLWQRDMLTGAEGPVKGLEDYTIGRYWDVTRDAIYFVRNDDPVNPKLHRYSLQTRQVTDLGRVRGALTKWVPGISISPDERLLAVSYLNQVFGDIVLVENWR